MQVSSRTLTVLSPWSFFQKLAEHYSWQAIELQSAFDDYLWDKAEFFGAIADSHYGTCGTSSTITLPRTFS